MSTPNVVDNIELPPHLGANRATERPPWVTLPIVDNTGAKHVFMVVDVNSVPGRPVCRTAVKMTPQDAVRLARDLLNSVAE